MQFVFRLSIPKISITNSLIAFRPSVCQNFTVIFFQHKYKKHKKNPNPKSPMMKQQVLANSYLTGMEKMDSPKSVYLSDDQASCSSQTNSMSAPPSPHPETFSSSINILKAVLTGSQEVSTFDLTQGHKVRMEALKLIYNYTKHNIEVSARQYS